MMKKYIFVGQGEGVPGLPHEVTDEQAKALGVEEILTDALANGNYKELKAKKESGQGEVSDG
jgi:hypothetical protein